MTVSALPDRAAAFDALPDHPYLQGAHTPLRQELSSGDLAVQGALPTGLRGSFVRNSGTPRHQPKGRYHWFDGDGMVHAVHLEGGRARYRNRWIRTPGFEREQAAGAAIWGGIMDPPDPTLPGGPLKDTANTDLVWWQGRLLALWWLSGQPQELRPSDLATLDPVDFGGTLRGRVSAHAKVCPRTGELVFFDYDVAGPGPWLRYGVVSPDGRVTRYVPVTTAGPRIPHDIAITEHYSILMDLPLGWDPAQLRRGRFRIAFDRGAPSRFGVIPRHGDDASIRWFELPASYVYHACGAFEQGDEIVMFGCKVDDLIPEVPSADPSIARMDVIELVPYLCRWTFNLRTGAASCTQLDDRATEFPRIRDDRWTFQNRYSYNPTIAPDTALSFDGVLKYDLVAGTSTEHRWPAGHRSGEVVFAPDPAGSAEDDGWLVTIVTDPAAGRSALWVLDARDLAAAPVAIVALPAQVPAGFHAEWCPRDAAAPARFA
jgi:carotenoid cleavage dioxygenase-like enzyme